MHALLRPVVWDSSPWLGLGSTRGCAALLAGQSIHSGNQKQGLRKWMLSEVTSQWGSTWFRSREDRTRTMGLWECAGSSWTTWVPRAGFLLQWNLNVLICVRWLEERWSGGFQMLALVGVELLLCPIAPALGQLPLSNLCGHMEDSVMKKMSEDWLSSPLPHLLSPCRATCQGHSTERTEWDIRLTRKTQTRSGEEAICLSESCSSNLTCPRLQCTCPFIFFMVFTGLVLCGLAFRLRWWFHTLDCFRCLSHTWKFIWLSSCVFSFFFIPNLTHCPLCTCIYPPFSRSSPSRLSFSQGQRHEESAGFPAEEEWVPRKQPSREVRQMYEVSQVSGHFLTACACRRECETGLWICKADMWVVGETGASL